MPLPADAAKRRYGFDFGIVPRMSILGDIEFMSRLGGSGFDAVGYTQVETLGLLVDAPVVGLMIRDPTAGLALFERFRQWTDGRPDEDPSSDGIEVAFSETADGGYAVTLSPSMDRLVRRVVPSWMEADVEAVPISGVFTKRFPHRSDAYAWFRQAAEGRPYVLALGHPGGWFDLDTSFVKREGIFYDVGDPDSPVTRELNAERVKSGTMPAPSPASPPQVMSDRRERRIRAYFHVTLARLGWSESYADALARLSFEGIRAWQVQQAACGIALHHARPDLFSTEGAPDVSIIQEVVGGVEAINRPLAPLSAYTLDVLRAQVAEDARRLLLETGVTGVAAASLDDVQLALSTAGYLDA